MDNSGLSKKKHIKNLYKSISDHLKISCENCGNINTINRKDCIEFMETEMFFCSKCDENILTNEEAVHAINKVME